MNEISISEWIKADTAYIVPIGDVHLGDVAFTKVSEDKLRGYIKWIKDMPGARCILMGDIFNTATRSSKTPPFSGVTLKDEMTMARDYFRPIRRKILGAISGNHEQRLEDFANYDPMIPFCESLDLKYLQYSGVFKIGVGVAERSVRPYNSPHNTYIIYAHHTTGGGQTVGGRLNRVYKMKDLVINADVYIGAHNHGLADAVVEGFEVDRRSGKVSRIRQHLVNCGGYLDWNQSYAEKNMFPPLKIGSPRIRLDGTKRDVKVSE